MSVPKLNHFINGQAVKPSSGRYTNVFNPATGEIIAEVAMGDSDDLDLAVRAARAAFEDQSWRGQSPVDRANLLYAIAGRIQEHAEELALMEVNSSGGTISRISTLDMLVIIDICQVMAELVKGYPFIQNLPPRPLPEPTHARIVKEPVGVCGLISAWNFPLALMMLKVIPAIAAGNTVVIKPSELTPNSTLRCAELLADLLPDGVLNVVNGIGAEVGAAIGRHPDINKVSFTGSTRVGKQLMADAASSMKRTTMELGGKSAAIVLPDADIELTAHGVLFGIMLNSGQACESGTRLLVHRDIEDRLLSRIRELAGQLVIGNPLEPSTSMGPMSSIEHGERVLAYIASAIDEGAEIICGGNRIDVPGFDGGFFIEPTVIGGVQNDMKVAREEIFGPVLSVISFDTVEEAIALANDSNYGLAAGIWSQDLVTAESLALRIQAGSVWINDWHMLRTDAPFGGYKESGIGREMGVAGFEAYLETKVISTAFQRQPGRKMLYPIVHKTMA